MKKLIFFLTILLLINGCSNDDNSISEQEQIIDGGIAKTSELVIISTNNITQQQYQGNLGNQSVSVVKTAENELTFKIPNTMETGEQLLTIPDLDNLKIRYEIVEMQITGTAEENLGSFFTNINDYLTSIESSANFGYVNGFVERFNESFQNMSEEEKIIIAKYYKVNQDRFDYVLTTDFSNRMMFDGTDLELLFRFSVSLVTFGASAYVAIADPEPFTRLASTLVAIIAYNKAYEYKLEFQNRQIKKINVLINALEASLDGRIMELEMTSGVLANFPLESNSRAIISSDVNDENQNITDFFSKNSIYNSTINSLNEVITFVNNAFFFSNIDLIPVSTIDQTSPIVTELGDEEFFDRLSLSIESNNVNMDNPTFSNGNLNITASIIDDTNVNEFVETNINFSYEDDFNRLAGSFPVKIYKETNEIDLSGEWFMDFNDEFELYSWNFIFNDDNTITFIDNQIWVNQYLTTNTYSINDNALTLAVILTYPDQFCTQLKEMDMSSMYDNNEFDNGIYSRGTIWNIDPIVPCDDDNYDGTFLIRQ